jgi:hypothetical protein
MARPLPPDWSDYRASRFFAFDEWLFTEGYCPALGEAVWLYCYIGIAARWDTRRCSLDVSRAARELRRSRRVIYKWLDRLCYPPDGLMPLVRVLRRPGKQHPEVQLTRPPGIWIRRAP